MQMVSIIIGGDICPSGGNESAFQRGDAKEIFKNTIAELEDADITVCNLEAPMISQESPIDKTGANFGVSPACINGIVAGGFDAINLANNHILDHGEKGVFDTISTCEKAGVGYFGAGKNLKEASNIWVKEVDGKRIAFLGVTEHEFSIAGESSWGANSMDVIDVTRVLHEAKSHCDFIILLVHGGKEHYPYPTPSLQKYCRFMVDQGVGAVICQHSHCIGSYEYYSGAPIIYGQGNFVFEATKGSKPNVLEGLLVKLILDGSNECSVQWIPVLQSVGIPGVQLMLDERREQVLRDFKKRSSQIMDKEFVRDQWIQECRRDKYNYASLIMGFSRGLRFLNKKLHFSDWLYSTESRLLQQNVVRCETHREVLETLWQDSKR